MEWDQIIEKWAVMTQRLCQDGQGARRQPTAPRNEGSGAPTVQPVASTLAPLVGASPDP